MVSRPAGPRRLARSARAVVLSLTAMVYAGAMSPAASAGSDPARPEALIPVVVDIRPGICPNHIRIESALPIPVAVFGTMDFEVANVDPGSMRLSRDGVAEEVEPLSWAYMDVGVAVVGGLCACHELRGDGLDDVALYFSIDDMATTLGLMEHLGEMIPLTLSGKLLTGEDIEGTDCAVMISGAWANDEVGSEIGMLERAGEDLTGGPFGFAYYTTVSDRVTFAIYDIQGQVVAKLIDMDMAPGIYHATWNGTGRNTEQVPPGTYFARVSNSWTSDTRKITIPR